MHGVIHVSDCLQSLSKLLNSNEVEVRAAAGEAIALLYQSCGLSNLDAVLESEQDELEPDSPTDSEAAVDHYNDLVTQAIPTLDAQSSAQPVVQSDTSTSQPSTGDPIGGSQIENGSSLLNVGYSSPSAFADSAQHPLSSIDERNRTDAASTTAEASTSAQALHVDGVPHSNELNTDNDTSASATSPTADNNSTPAKAANTGKQQPGKNPKPPSHLPAKNPRNPKQQAEAISNGLDDVVGRMRDLATNKGDSTRRSRKDRASSRSTFRELCSVVEVSFAGDNPWSWI